MSKKKTLKIIGGLIANTSPKAKGTKTKNKTAKNSQR